MGAYLVPRTRNDIFIVEGETSDWALMAFVDLESSAGL